MITNIDIDEALVAQAMQVSGARTKRDVVDRALREMVARARRPRFRDFLGVGDIDPAYDPKLPDPAGGPHRVEQGRAVYRVPDALSPPVPPAAATPARKKPVGRR